MGDFGEKVGNTQNIWPIVVFVLAIGDDFPVTAVASARALALNVDRGAIWRLGRAPVWGLN